MKFDELVEKDVIVAGRYSNLVRFINDNAMWSLYEVRNNIKIKRIIKYSSAIH